MRWPAKPVSPAMQWDDPLASGLLHYQVMADGAGPNAVDLVRGGRATFVGGTGVPGPSWRPGHAGPELSWNGEVRYLSSPTGGMPVGNFDLTISVAFNTTNAGSNLYFFHYGSTSGTNSMFAVGVDNAGQLRMTHWAAGGNTPGFAAHDGQPHVGTWTYTASSGLWRVLYDGEGKNTFVQILSIPANPVLSVGALTGLANLPYIGQVAAVAFWNRVLTDPAIVRFSADPFVMARRPSPLVPWIGTGMPPTVVAGHPTMRRWGGIPGMHGGASKGRGW